MALIRSFPLLSFTALLFHPETITAHGPLRLENLSHRSFTPNPGYSRSAGL